MENFDLKGVFDFIKKLEANNNREWFAENKEKYLTAKQDFEIFLDIIGKQLEEVDPEFRYTQVKDYTFRIYRDIRFSKNKAPYKNHFGAFFANGGRKTINGGYYLHIEPNASFIGGGVYSPQKEVLKAMRQEIYYSHKDFEKIILNEKFTSYYPELRDNKLKNGPKDFPKDCEAINWLKYKSFAVGHNLTNDEVVSSSFDKEVIKGFATLQPMVEFLNTAIKEN